MGNRARRIRVMGAGITAALWLAVSFLSPLPSMAETTPATPVATSEADALADGEDAGQEVTADELAEDVAALTSLQDNLTMNTQAKLNALFARYDTLGACVCVIENGRITYAFCYGLIAPGGAPITENTLFRVGSISKMVTAMGMMRLVEDGKAELDEDLSDLFGFTVRNPQYPKEEITLRQLMSHTAGLRDNGAYNKALQGDAEPLEKLFTGNARSYLFTADSRPGMKMQYSNFGGGLLGTLVETLSGETLDDYMNQMFFTPLGITAAYQAGRLPADALVSDQYAMPAGRLAATVRSENETVSTLASPETDYIYSAGKLTLSAPDLAKLVIALCDGGIYGETRVLKESSAAEMRTAQTYIGSVNCDSGWGLDMSILKDTMVEGRTMYGHGGKANGMLCTAYFDPTDRTGVVMLTNGCRNRKTYQGVGMLSLLTVRLCYTELLTGRHTAVDPWLVDDSGETQPESSES
ncbi:MAG TPA: serine hydrolase domain-containing protein [Candidatus Limiplasma sp.]|nr:serine hydrolase domain-containing protein [Candidatus Limiplasma sp.]